MDEADKHDIFVCCPTQTLIQRIQTLVFTQYGFQWFASGGSEINDFSGRYDNKKTTNILCLEPRKKLTHTSTNYITDHDIPNKNVINFSGKMPYKKIVKEIEKRLILRRLLYGI